MLPCSGAELGTVHFISAWGKESEEYSLILSFLSRGENRAHLLTTLDLTRRYATIKSLEDLTKIFRFSSKHLADAYVIIKGNKKPS